MKYFRYLMITILCLAVFFSAGCGKRDSNTGGSLEKPILSWQASYTPLEISYDFVLAADRIYGCYVKDDQTMLDMINKQDISMKESLTIPNAALIMGMAADREGNVYLMGSIRESTRESTKESARESTGESTGESARESTKESTGEGMGLWKISTEGKLLNYTEIELEDTEGTQDLLLKGIYTDQHENFFLWCEMFVKGEESGAWHREDWVYVKDAQLKTVFCEKIPDRGGTEVLCFQVGMDGRPFFLVKDSDGVYIQEIDVAQNGRKDAERLEEAGEFSDADYVNAIEKIAPADDGFLYCRDNELFVFDYETRETEKLFHLSSYGIFSSDILFMKKEGDTIEIIDNHGTLGNTEFISFILGETKKRTVTLGSTLTLSDLEKKVAEFNRYNSEYQVEIVDYVAQKGNYEDAVEQLKLDLVSGKAPNIITVGGLDYGIFAEKGMFADLYDFMKEDKDCNREMFVQSVEEAYEDQGHLYRVSPSFQLHSMWGYGDVTGGKSGVTFEELFQMLEENGKDLNAIAGFSADEPILSRLCMVSMEEFVDWENGICSFDGDYFQKVLSFAGEYTGNYTGGAYSERIRKREVVMSVGVISSVTDYQMQNALYGGKIAFVGYPVVKGSGTAVAFRADAVAINAKNEEQTGAWEFVKFYLLHGYDGQGFPIIQKQFDRVLEDAMVEDYGISEDGQEEKYPKTFYNDGGGDIFIYAASQEDIDSVRKLVESAETRCEWNQAIQSIVNEEAEGYFYGQKTVEEAAGLIQNRVKLYLNEGR